MSVTIACILSTHRYVGMHERLHCTFLCLQIVNSCTCMNACTNTNTFLCACSHTHMCSHTCMCIHARPHKHTESNTYTNKQVHLAHIICKTFVLYILHMISNTFFPCYIIFISSFHYNSNGCLAHLALQVGKVISACFAYIPSS